MFDKIDKKKLIHFTLVVLVSILFTYFAHPFIKDNTDAINLLVTTFSILVGFLLAVITLVGDPKTLPSGSWRIAQAASETTFNRLARQQLLFVIYLLTIILIFISMLIKKKFEAFSCYIEYAYLFFASIAIIYSFKLPAMIISLQQERINCEIAARRKLDNIKD